MQREEKNNNDLTTLHNRFSLNRSEELSLHFREGTSVPRRSEATGTTLAYCSSSGSITEKLIREDERDRDVQATKQQKSGEPLKNERTPTNSKR